jgi:hypothetical protein
LQQELSLKEPDVKDLLEKGNKLIQGASPSAEVRAISDTLGELKVTDKFFFFCRIPFP